MASGTRIPFSGVMLILFGALFLADQMGAIHFGQVFHVWWPAILVVAGLLSLLEKPTSPFGAIVLLVVGTGLLLANLHIVQMGGVWKLWPLVLIGLGLNILLSHGGRR